MTVLRPAQGWQIERIATHPGAVLSEDFLLPLHMSVNQLAIETGMPPSRVGEILHGRRSISSDTALRLGRLLGTSPEFWLNLQSAHNLSKTRLEMESTILRDIQPLNPKAVEA